MIKMDKNQSFRGYIPMETLKYFTNSSQYRNVGYIHHTLSEV